MSIESDRKHLSQNHNLELIRQDLKATELLTVYQWPPKNEGDRDYFILCALIPRDQIEQVLSERNIPSADPERMGGMPTTSDDYIKDGKKQVKYLRYGTQEGFEPLIISRSFSRIREAYNEISEEFRHFHDLYYDKKTDKYSKIDDAGNENIVAIVKPDKVMIRLKEIQQFLAVKEMYLSMLFEFNAFSRYTLQELGLNEVGVEFKQDDLICWRHDYSSGTHRYKEGFRSDSRLRGRRLIKPLPKSKSGFGVFAEESKYVEFIVDVDENGDEVHHTCDPYKLDDHPGENSDSVWKYTIVHFRRQVLDKYFIGEPSKYYVRDSMVGCEMWSMKIDDDHPDKVCVFLRELCNLPYTEQIYWKSYNIPPEGGLSRSFFERNIEGKWVNSNQPDHLFKQNYEQLQKACEDCLRWQVLKPMAPGDAYRLQRLRVPTVDEESHFKDSVLDLTSILIERLNEKRLENLILGNRNEEIKRGIDRLESVLDSRKIKGAEKHITFLRRLWDLRNTRGGSHPEFLKDSRYKRASAHFDLENLNCQEAFAKILEEAVQFLDFLISVVRSGKFSDNSDEDC